MSEILCICPFYVSLLLGEAREQFHSRMADKDELNSMYLYVSNCVTLRSWLTGWLVFTTRVQGSGSLNTSQVVHSWLDIYSCFSFAELGRYVFSIQPSDALCRKNLKLAHRRQPPELVLDCENVSSAPLDDKDSSHETNLVHIPAHFMLSGIRKIRTNSYLFLRDAMLRMVFILNSGSFAMLPLFELFLHRYLHFKERFTRRFSCAFSQGVDE